MSLEALLSTLVGVILGVVGGGLITWWVARHYYISASEDLRREAQALRAETVSIQRTANALGGALETLSEMLAGKRQMGLIKFARDLAGKILGVHQQEPRDVSMRIHLRAPGEELPDLAPRRPRRSCWTFWRWSGS